MARADRPIPEKPILLGLLILFAVSSLLLTIFGAVPHDEGFYAYASTAVYEGKTLYHDFMFPQSPVVAYVYGLSTLPAGFGIYAMRLVGLALGLAGAFLGWVTARRLAGPVAGLVAAAAIALSASFPSYVSPITLTATLVALSFFFLTLGMRPALKHALAGAAMALAAGVRLNVVVALPILAACAFLVEKERVKAAAASILGAGVVLLVVYGPFLAIDADRTIWDLVRYHVLDGREPGMGIASMLKYKLDGIHYFIRDYFFLVAAFVFVAGAWLWTARNRWVDAAREDALPVLMGLVVVLLVAANFTKVYIQPYYLAAVLPTMATLVGIGLARAYEAMPAGAGRAAFAGLAASVLILGFVGLVPEQIHKNLPAERPAVIREAGRYVESVTPSGSQVFSLYPIFPASAHREAVPGAEMGRLGYYPGMDNATADRYHLLNQWRMRETLSRAEAAAVVLQGGEFTYTTFPTAELPAAEQAAAVADMHAIIESRYHLDRTFGDGPGAVEVWLRN